MDRSTAPLTPAMTEAIKATGPEDVMAGGSTRTGLINRGMVHPKGSDRFGKLTESGLQVRAKLLPAPAAEVPNEAPEPVVEIELEPEAEDRTQAEARWANEDAAPHTITEAEHAEVNERHRMRSRGTGAGKSVLSGLHLNVTANVAPALASLAQVTQGLGRTLRPILEEGVRMARDIPEGRRRHGQVKARRDALRHARKMEIPSLKPAMTPEEREIARLRARHAATTIPAERERIQGKLAALGTVVYPEGTPEYAEYRAKLKAALADPKAWDFLEV
jgi:hypothetical protein